MTLPRSALVSVSYTPYYHIVSRCVRRAFLCGTDKTSGKDYEHRRQWIEDRIRILSTLFAVDICAYAVMSNHLHIVIKLCPEQIDVLSDQEVLQRWGYLFKGPLLMQKSLRGKTLSQAERQTLSDMCDVFRKRLASLSWFMKCLNEPIARRANQEDQCTGHFWESRFKSQALLTEEALLSCMAYVDLNPLRANMATTPESSEHTSFKERLKPQFDLEKASLAHLDEGLVSSLPLAIKPLAIFEGHVKAEPQDGILFCLRDYLELLDYTGRILRKDKKEAISQFLPPILDRLALQPDQWIKQCSQFEALYEKQFRRKRKYPTKQAA